MLNIARDAAGDYRLTMPFPLLLHLQQLPDLLRRVLEGGPGTALHDRLFPNAYADAGREAEYRSLIGADLIERKRAAIALFEGILDKCEVELPSARIVIPEGDFDSVLAFINDIRVLLGVELGIEEEGWGDIDDEDDDPRRETLSHLHLLTYVEGALIDATGLVPSDLEQKIGEAFERGETDVDISELGNDDEE